ncbi:MAG: MATE family efflux transporter [Lysobacterales bacterium]
MTEKHSGVPAAGRANPDLTSGPIFGHLLRMAIPIAIGLLFQNLYHLIDLYFVAQLGDAAIAGVSAAGNLMFMVLALTQALSVGIVALVGQALGRRDLDDAQQVFNQSLGLSVVCCVLVWVLGAWLTDHYLAQLAAGEEAQAEGRRYLLWFLPCLALQFPVVALGSAMRGCGVVQPAMLVQLLTVVLNAILAPVLIAGWGTRLAFGVAGAGAASSIALIVGMVLMWRLFRRLSLPVTVQPSLLRPRAEVFWRLLRIGAPAGGEFLLLFIYMALIYWLVRPFGADAQAGFGIGSRVMQAVFLPAMAVAFAVSAVAAQNVGAGLAVRVREVFRQAALLCCGLMFLLTLFCQWQAGWLLSGFSDDPAVLAVGVGFLQVVSWNFAASGLVFTCSSLFQALGHTLPSLLSSASRLLTFALPAIWISRQEGFELRQLWWLSVTTVGLQALLSYLLLRREMSRRLPLRVEPSVAL